jgi:hypothetical protein
MRLRSLLQALLLCVAIAGSAQASLNITISDLALSPGGTGTLDISISGDRQKLAGFNSLFVVAPTDVSVTSWLDFTPAATQPDPSGDPAYVFHGNSFGYLVGVPALDTLEAGDNVADFNNVPEVTDQLLTRVTLQHSYGAADPATTIGHTFTVALVPESGVGTLKTFFLDDLFVPISYTSEPGQVTIIPEPSQLTIMLGLGGVFLVGCWWRRRKRSAGA